MMSAAAPTVIETEMWVPAPLELVWNFFSDAKNLAKITPAWHGISVPAGIYAQNGAQIELTMNPLGLPLDLKWLAEYQDVVDVGEKRQFVDVQTKGPFAHWKHIHSFEEGVKELVGERSGGKIRSHAAGTWIKDHLEYQVGHGVLGEAANKALLKRTLEKMFSYRKKRLSEIFSSLT